MRNGTRFNSSTMGTQRRVDGLQEGDGLQDDADDAASYYPYKPQSDQAFSDQAFADEAAQVQKTFVVFLSLSVACAAATLATGSYAAWLSRHQAARQALTDVNEILKSCQSRMSQLEADLKRLPTCQEESPPRTKNAE